MPIGSSRGYLPLDLILFVEVQNCFYWFFNIGSGVSCDLEVECGIMKSEMQLKILQTKGL